MNDTMTVTKGKITLLNKREAYSGRMRIAYRLYAIESECGREYYVIEVAGAAEGELAAVGSDYAYARVLFERIVCGTVTPVALFDVVSDAYASKKY